MLSGAAFNALLKTLEEPPEYMVFILATTEPQKLPATILSRCQRYDFGRIADAQIVSRLKQAIPEDTQADEEALQLIASAAEGSMRDALSLMDQCIGFCALACCDSEEAITEINTLMRQGRDVQVFLRDFSAHLRQVLGVKLTGQPIHAVGCAVAEKLRQQASSVSEINLLRMLDKCMQAENDTRWAATPRAVLDVYALRSCQVDQEQDLSGILARLCRLETAAVGMVSDPSQVSTKETAPSDLPEPAPQPDTVLPLAQPPKSATSQVLPKTAWNRMLERLGREHPGLFSLMQRGRYGGFREDVFSLILPPKEDIFTDMLNEGGRAQVISQLLQDEMGIPVSFRAARQANTPDIDQETLAQENIALLSGVFGRDKIIVKSDPS